jgi:hypothetical protein
MVYPIAESRSFPLGTLASLGISATFMSPDRGQVLMLTAAAGADITLKPVVGRVCQPYNGVCSVPLLPVERRRRYGVVAQDPAGRNPSS